MKNLRQWIFKEYWLDIIVTAYTRTEAHRKIEKLGYYPLITDIKEYYEKS